MQLDIERGAGLAIWESATQSLQVVPWRPRPDITSQNAVSRPAVQPPAAICALPVGFCLLRSGSLPNDRGVGWQACAHDGGASRNNRASLG
jgi:hypothetical protein